MFEGVAATLPASDMDRALQFYSDRLGLSPVERTEQGGSAMYEVGDTVLVLYPSQFAGTNQATAAGFMVADIEAAVAGLRGKGVVFDDLEYGDLATVDGVMTMPDGTKAAWFKDSEGNSLGVFQR